jgi:hypothetical protein
VVDCSNWLAEIEEASAERVVIHGVAIVAKVELGDVRVWHESSSLGRRVVDPGVGG